MHGMPALQKHAPERSVFSGASRTIVRESKIKKTCVINCLRINLVRVTTYQCVLLILSIVTIMVIQAILYNKKAAFQRQQYVSF